MSSATPGLAAAVPIKRRRRPLTTLALRAWSQWRVRVGVALVVFMVMVVALGPIVAPHSPSEFVGVPFQPPSSSAPLGTDYLGHDVLSRVLWGGATILELSLASALLGVALGTAVGVLAAYSRGIWDNLLMRAMDVLLAFPAIIFALLVIATVGSKLWLLVIAIAISHAPRVARLTRGASVDIVERDFVRAVEAMGERTHKILRGEILPNIAGPLLVETSLRITFSVGLVAALSFLGFGLQPPAADWGLMISENQNGLTTQPWSVVAPIICIALLTIGASLIADGLARALAGIERTAER
jgi:peptide/nickel transport system permease protein